MQLYKISKIFLPISDIGKTADNVYCLGAWSPDSICALLGLVPHAAIRLPHQASSHHYSKAPHTDLPFSPAWSAWSATQALATSYHANPTMTMSTDFFSFMEGVRPMTHPFGPQASTCRGVLTKRTTTWLSQRDLQVHHVEINIITRPHPRSGLSHTDPMDRKVPRLPCYQRAFFQCCQVLAELMLPPWTPFFIFIKPVCML